MVKEGGLARGATRVYQPGCGWRSQTDDGCQRRPWLKEAGSRISLWRVAVLSPPRLSNLARYGEPGSQGLLLAYMANSTDWAVRAPESGYPWAKLSSDGEAVAYLPRRNGSQGAHSLRDVCSKPCNEMTRCWVLLHEGSSLGDCDRLGRVPHTAGLRVGE